MDGSTAALAPIELRLPVTPESVSAARHEVAAYLRALGVESRDAELAVGEAVKNAVEHAFRGIDRGTITLRIQTLVPDTVALTVSDDGIGITPDPDKEGLGLGLSLIGRMCSAFDVSAGKPHGTILSMRLPLVETPPGSTEAAVTALREKR